VENVAVFGTGQLWTMIYSEGLADQHLAYVQSSDLRNWTRRGRIELPVQRWMARRYGAPCIFRDGDRWVMVLMGQDTNDRTTFGLLSSRDGIGWFPLPER
jgi:sucrose-6-phosphate hydrolase SacC (GH32 family)